MRRLAFILALCIGLVASARAEERITSFVSDVTVNADASLSVRETITVQAEGHEIKRGILRDFPTVYRDRMGQRVAVGFEVLGVERNGQDEPWSLESISNGKRIRIGDKDVPLDFGQHTYRIAYRTTRQIGFFPDVDELYWNATGNGWTFAIEHASVAIRLPPGAGIRQHAEYTGPQGSTQNDARVVSRSDTLYVAETTRRLEPNEGFTVAVGFQKGIVTPPGGNEKLGWWLSDNAGLFALGLSLFAAGLYYLYAWNRVGRDPPRGTIIPLFAPPQGLGPAGLRYVRTYGADDRGFAAGLVGLAVKGRLKIADDDGSFTVTKLSAPAKAAALTKSEQALLGALPNGSTALKQANNASVRAARAALKSALEEEYEGTVLLRNLKWFWAGLAVSILCLVAAALLMPPEDGMLGLFAVAWSGIWWSAVLAVMWGAVRGAIGAPGLLKKLSSLATLMVMIPFLGAGVLGPALVLFGAGSAGLYMLVATAALLGLMNVVFFHLLRAPTEPGRKLLDQIEGFRLYLTTAEEDRLNVLHPPEKTPELFERYLPYALVLDCENEWNAKFAAVLAAAAMAGAVAPAWYSGSNWNSGTTGGFTDSLGKSLSSSVASASTAPGRSSGSGGGGRSGGGGGGGGGSGW